MDFVDGGGGRGEERTGWMAGLVSEHERCGVEGSVLYG